MLQQRLCSLVLSNNLQARTITSASYLANSYKWRQDRGLPVNPTTHGVLTDSPDYSYLDGRLTPLGANQKKRVLKQRDVLGQIIDLTGEIDYAVERHKQIQINEENRKKGILDRKLKPKGLALLKSK